MAPTTPAATAARPPLSHAARLAQERRGRREARYQDIHALHRQGLATARSPSNWEPSRTTVGKYLAAPTCPVPASRPGRRRLIAPFVAFLHQRWNAGEQRAHILWEEIQQQGFTGSVGRVREQLALWRSMASLRATTTAAGARRAAGRATTRRCPTALATAGSSVIAAPTR